MAHSAKLNWTASVDAVDGYNIYRSPVATLPGVKGVKVNTTLVVGTTFTDTTVGVGEYFYEVVAVVGAVESLESNEVRAVVLPAAPTNLVIIVL